MAARTGWYDRLVEDYDGQIPLWEKIMDRQGERKGAWSGTSLRKGLESWDKGSRVDAEYDSSHNNNIKRLIKNAKFSDSSAFLGNIDYLPDRNLNRDLLESLADNSYIRQGLNVILIGATGSGKSFIANALGVNACQPDIHREMLAGLP